MPTERQRKSGQQAAADFGKRFFMVRVNQSV
jgi:hypothetical protein